MKCRNYDFFLLCFVIGELKYGVGNCPLSVLGIAVALLELLRAVQCRAVYGKSKNWAVLSIFLVIFLPAQNCPEDVAVADPS